MSTRWGICSAGKISHDFTVALRSPESNGDHQVVAVAARSLQDAKAFATMHGIPRAYGSYEELARDPDIDVVYIGVIHPYHMEVSILFMNHQKNVLCEKPMAMSSRETQEMVTSARTNNVFLMEAMWTRFFPASVEIRRLLSAGALGDVRMVRADFGAALLHVARATQRELGGGALLDIGVYCLQFVCMVYDGERPESVQATGVCLDTGVDETMAVSLKFSGGRMAVFTCSVAVEMPNDAVIVGTKGTIRIPAHMWCPTSLVLNGEETRYPVPEPVLPLNFTNSTGLRYQADEVRRCLLKGLKESPGMSLSDSLMLAELRDEALRQVGVAYQSRQ